LLDSVGMDRKATVIHNNVPIAISNNINAGWPWWLWLIIGVMVGSCIVLLIMVFIRGR
jgi:hypothetical protein